ncbi:Family of unknown function (DUF648) [Chlamydia serpentis]|uniref:Uncharacterized protein n=1 Tax=Chlamydia serpentis TaxID=1967782 RepID=A0A2R8FAN6_9CHLA|nr:DUF648 domain-containing protein [Chlamydia serpentis]SPN73317.1 Family of unknown function (DUF648) [Chlamydia serpentis]
MNISTFSPGVCPNWAASVMSKLDSYFCLGGKTTRVISYPSPSELTLAKEEHTKVSTIVKILKIISFIIFFPLVIVALAIRYLLHKKFDRKCFYLPEGITKEEELILAANSKLVKEAALEVSPSFFALPKKYQVIKVETPEGQAPKITFSINIELLLKDLDLQSIDWPTVHLYDDIDFTGHPEEKALIDKIRKIEGKDSKQMSLESKILLTRHLLEHVFVYSTKDLVSINPELTDYPSGRATYMSWQSPSFEKRHEPSFWKKMYFDILPGQTRDYKKSDCGVGFIIYDRLLELGLTLPIPTEQLIDQYGYPVNLRYFMIFWENEFQSVLKDQGLIQE